jgi:hypothetical protein
MGTYGTLRRASAADVDRLRASPSLVESFVFGDPMPPPPKGGGLFGFLRRHSPFGGTATQPAAAAEPATVPTPEPTWPAAAEGEELQLDKAWHGLHFLFTGEAEGGEEPGCYLLEGGEEIGEDDAAASLLSPEQVRAFAAL